MDGAIVEIRGKQSESVRNRLSDDPAFVKVSKSGTGSRLNERYIHAGWTNLHARLQQSSEVLISMENEIFLERCKDMLRYAREITMVAHAISELDVASCGAKMALENNHCRPTLVPCDDSNTPVHDISGGRHPVVEYMQKLSDGRVGGDFVENDCIIGGEKERLWCITGPNMGGKSTFLRQCALMSILAQAGFYVPASRARLGIVDRLLSRMGTSDNLTGDQSSFMVEMRETAGILRNATRSSLILLDEVGRGTSPREAMALAFGILKFIDENMECRALFATHFTNLFDRVSETRKMFV
ncbi:MAG: hypothetical protein SGCHY_004807 [Lobulomycetales sp.]